MSSWGGNSVFDDRVATPSRTKSASPCNMSEITNAKPIAATMENRPSRAPPIAAARPAPLSVRDRLSPIIDMTKPARPMNPPITTIDKINPVSETTRPATAMPLSRRPDSSLSGPVGGGGTCGGGGGGICDTSRAYWPRRSGSVRPHRFRTCEQFLNEVNKSLRIRPWEMFSGGSPFTRPCILQINFGNIPAGGDWVQSSEQ